MICDKCGWPMVTRQVEGFLVTNKTPFGTDLVPYHFQSVCTRNAKHRVTIDMEDSDARLAR